MKQPSPFLKRLRLENFKSFPSIDLEFSQFTAILGGNGAGKSNLVAAIRFLEGLGRGLTLAEILDGIPGGSAEIAFGQGNRFVVEIVLDFGGEVADYSYRVECRREPEGPFLIAREQLWHEERQLFQTELGVVDGEWVAVTENQHLSPTRSILFQLPWTGVAATLMRTGLGMIRCYDFSAEGLRSVAPGDGLGHTGTNLAAALRRLEPETLEIVVNWVRELEPSLANLADGDLVDNDGTRWRVQGASEGTLRFLAYLAALYESHGQGLTLFENIETGIHPTRLGLLLSALQSRRLRTEGTDARQVLFTTHSPLVLQWLDPAERLRAIATFRQSGQRGTRALPLGTLPEALGDKSIGHRFAEGWLEVTR